MTFTPVGDHAVSTKRTINLTRVADVRAQPIRWLAPGRVPYGTLTVLAGNPGEGKSQLTLNLAARLSHEAPTLLIGNEDGIAEVVRPRLMAQGADLERVMAFDLRNERGFEEDAVLPTDIPLLEQAIMDTGAGLVIVDPFNAHLDHDLSAFNDHMVRQASRPLARMARKTGAAVIIITHLRKSRDGSPMDWVMGSGLVGAARSVLLFGKVKGTDAWDDDLRWLFSVKGNGSRLAPPLRCRVQSAWVDGDEGKIETSRVVVDEDDRSKHPEDLA